MKKVIFTTSIAFFLAVSVQDVITAADNQSIKLPRPSTESRTSIENALQKRRSVRAYKDLKITLSDLSQLLWAAQGISGKGLRTAPSAGALYPLEVSVVAGNVNDLQAGVYLYKPEGHELLKIADNDKRAGLSRAAWGQAAMQNAPAVLVISAVYERTTVKYGERGIRYVHMEAGHAAQNVYLQAVSLNIGTVAIGAFDEEGVKEAAYLTIREQPLYLMPVGRQ